MRQQIIVSGIGGQGVLFLTRLIAEAAVQAGRPVLTAETHGMAQRGGSVLSTLKVGAFKSPLIRRGGADAGLFLHGPTLALHRSLVGPDGALIVNREEEGEGVGVDALGLARKAGNPLLANLILLGCAVQVRALFCDETEVEVAIRALSPEKFVAQNLEAFKIGIMHSKTQM